MPASDLLRTLEMQVLARRGRAADVYIDGYLAQPSERANQRDSDESKHHLVFGYVEGDRPLPRWRVVVSADENVSHGAVVDVIDQAKQCGAVAIGVIGQ